MNILIDTRAIYPFELGGKEIYVYHLIKELANLGNEIWVSAKHEVEWNDKGIHNILMPSYRHKIISYPAYVHAFFSQLPKIKNFDIDVYHSHYFSYPGILPNLTKGIYKKPYVLTVHDTGVNLWYRRFLVSNADAIIVISPTVKRLVEDLNIFNKEIVIIPPVPPFNNVSDTKQDIRLEYGVDQDSTVILFVGRLLEFNKGCLVLLKVFESLGIDYITKNNLKLVFVGDGPDRNVLEEEIKGTEFSQHVHFFGQIPNEFVSKTYKMSDIFVIPSHFEGFGITATEATFHSLPVVASDIDGLRDRITDGKNGLLVEPGNIEKFANAIKLLIEDENLRKKIGRMGNKTYLEKFTFEMGVDKHLELYNRLMENR